MRSFLTGVLAFLLLAAPLATVADATDSECSEPVDGIVTCVEIADPGHILADQGEATRIVNIDGTDWLCAHNYDPLHYAASTVREFFCLAITRYRVAPPDVVAENPSVPALSPVPAFTG